MDDFVSESESDYTSYWRDWVSSQSIPVTPSCRRQSHIVLFFLFGCDLSLGWAGHKLRKHRTALRESKPPTLHGFVTLRFPAVATPPAPLRLTA